MKWLCSDRPCPCSLRCDRFTSCLFCDWLCFYMHCLLIHYFVCGCGRRCLESKCYNAASQVLSEDIYAVDPAGTCCTPRDLYLYCRYGSSLCIGVQHELLNSVEICACLCRHGMPLWCSVLWPSLKVNIHSMVGVSAQGESSGKGPLNYSSARSQHRPWPPTPLCWTVTSTMC
jgi:hypothetical protein